MAESFMAQWVYTDTVKDHFINPRNLWKEGEDFVPDGVGEVGSLACGDQMRVGIKVSDGRITDLRWLTYGCASAIASTSMMSEMAIGMTLEEAYHLTPQMITEALGGLPEHRGVVSTCSYEARAFGVHSAMPTRTAFRLCPEAVLLHPDIKKYKRISAVIRGIFHDFTDLVEPVSIDEAYLDVTVNKRGERSATRIAREIQREIFLKTRLTASAGVSCNKFLAKVASDLHKPDRFSTRCRWRSFTASGGRLRRDCWR